MKKILFLASLLLITTSLPAQAENTPPVLVVDKCPEFCPPGIKGPTRPILVVDKCPEFCPPGVTVPNIKGPVNPPKRMCAQVLIPVPGKRGWFWTDSCKTKMVNSNTGKKR
jgi:hypothetical protein